MTPENVAASRSIFLSSNVPSSKNSKELGYYFLKPEDNSGWYIKKGESFRKIRPTLRNSDLTEAYIKHIVAQIIENKPKFKALVKDLPKPYIVQVHFVRGSKHGFDYINAMQVLADCMTGKYWKNDKKIPFVSTQWIDEDDADNLIMIPPLKPPHYSYDKLNPGVWLTVLDTLPKTEDKEPIKDWQAFDAGWEASKRNLSAREFEDAILNKPISEEICCVDGCDKVGYMGKMCHSHFFNSKKIDK